MYAKPYILLFFAILINTTAFAQSINKAKLDSLFDALWANNRTMGSFAIAKGGKVIYSRSIGYSLIDSTGKKIKADNHTLYNIGSVSKMFTAVMIFQLIDEGKLSLQTKLSEYYPQISGADSITIECLLEHRSGLFDVTNESEDEFKVVRHSREEIMNTIIKGKRNFKPGTQTKYCNTGFTLMAWLVEKLTGQTFNQNLQNRICRKIGLNNTYSPLNDQYRKDQAEPYIYANNWEPIPDLYDENLIGESNVFSTPEDLIAFGNALLNGKLMSATSLKAMMTFKHPEFGRGICIAPWFDKSAYGHVGDTRGSHSALWVIPDNKLTVAICINGYMYSRDVMMSLIVKSAFDKSYKLPSFGEFEVSKNLLKRYAGVYSNSDGPGTITLSISKDGSGLIFQMSGQPAVRFYATAANVFKYDAYGVTIVFDSNEKLRVQQHLGEITYKRTSK